MFLACFIVGKVHVIRIDCVVSGGVGVCGGGGGGGGEGTTS